MSRPSLNIEPHPSQQGKIYYLPLAPHSRDHEERLKLVISIEVRNTGSEAVTINNITFSFPGTNRPVETMEREQDYMEPEGGALRPDQVATWCNGSYTDAAGEKRYNQIYMDLPAPSRININVYCDGFTQPHTQQFDLIPWRPGAASSFIMPFSLADLEDDEYISASARHWYNGGAKGLQAYGHDMKIIGRVDGELTSRNRTTATQNSHIRVFGRPVRAMADGIVTKVVDGNPDNAYGVQTEGAEANYVRVQHGTLEIKYSHLKQDSVRVEEGQAVVAGQRLGEGGNSGHSNGTPHLHIEGRTVPGHTLRGFNFRKAWQLDTELVPADDSPGRRVSMDRRGVCEQSAAIRPFSTNHVPVAPQAQVELDEMVAEVFGGVSRGGDGFVIVNGRLTRVPPRGIKTDLMNAILALDAADELAKPAALKSRKAATAAAEEALAAFKQSL